MPTTATKAEMGKRIPVEECYGREWHSGLSPEALSMRRLAEHGYTPVSVTAWRRGAGGWHRWDLFGCIDLLGFRGEDVIAIQATSFTNVPARVRKIAASPEIGLAREAGWQIEVWGWRRAPRQGPSAPARWQVRVEDVS